MAFQPPVDQDVFKILKNNIWTAFFSL